MKKLTSGTNIFTRIATYISGIILLAATLLVVINVIGRRFFNAPILGASELICYFALAAASFSLIETEWIDGNVKNTFFFEKAGKKAVVIAELIGNTICAPVVGFISYLLVNQIFQKIAKNDVSMELKFPMYIVATALAIGFVCLTVVLIVKVIIRVRDLCKKTCYNFKLQGGNEAEEAMEMVKENKE